jgi:hypothetical protein
MRHSYFLAGITIPNLFTLLRTHKISYSPRFLGRILFLWQNALWASLLQWREKRIYREQIQQHSTPHDPVFIVGHWRTGTTFLHQLLLSDDRHTSPTLFQITAPVSFLISRKYYEPILSKVLKNTRPMDNVKMGLDEPQEDEYALMKLTLDSPLLDVIFPKDEKYFLSRIDHAFPKDEKKWKEELFCFYKKIDLATNGKKLIIKNPIHSLRIPLLKQWFPNARFIHIVRDPIDVVPSTLHLWKIVGEQNKLNNRGKLPSSEEVIQGIQKIWKKIEESFSQMPEERWFLLKYEDLEDDPVKEINKLYKHFGWDFSEQCLHSLRNTLDELRDYKKNRYVLTQEQRDQISSLMHEQLVRYGYLSQ